MKYIALILGVGWAALLFWLLGSTPTALWAQQDVITVTTSAELSAALQTVQPSQTIQLADGVYSGAFTIAISGTAKGRITLQGSLNAVLDGGGVTAGYGLYLKNVNYWVLRGFTIRNAAKGLVLDKGKYNLLDGLLIETIGQEAVHFRACSTYNILQNSTIRNTGVISPGFGEGVYIGSDMDDWPTFGCASEGQEKSDKSHYNQILFNRFGPNVRAEAIDIKEGTKEGKLLGNRFDATGLSGENAANSWVDIKGNGYEVADNIGYKGDPSALQDGFETHTKVAGWGKKNQFRHNVACVLAAGYGFNIDTQSASHGNVVYADNQVYAADKGITNIAVSPVPTTSLTSASSLPRTLTVPATFTTPINTNIWLPMVSRGC